MFLAVLTQSSVLISVSDIKNLAIISKHINYTAKGKVMLNFYTNKIMTLKDFFLIIMKSVMSTPIDHAELGLVLPEIRWADRHNISLAEGQ